MPEAYPNLKQMLDLLNIEALEFSFSADIKMCKYLLQSHKNISICFLVLLLCGKPTGKPKHNSPFITGPENLLVLDLLNCSSLHILIGKVIS